jgi:hypothetical protein
MPYQNLISAAPNLSTGEFTLSGMTMDRIRNQLPDHLRHQRFFAPNTFAVLLENAFQHLHNNFPIFHRPTMQIENFPTYLTLATASLGALLSDDNETQQLGLTLHNHIRDVMFSVRPF